MHISKLANLDTIKQYHKLLYKIPFLLFYIITGIFLSLQKYQNIQKNQYFNISLEIHYIFKEKK